MTKPWAIPRLWSGATVAVLASGPSMNKAFAECVRHWPCIAVNTTYQLAPWADMLYAHDAAWWIMNPEAQAFAGLKVSGQAGPFDALLLDRDEDDANVRLGPCHVVSGMNSGHTAVRIAAEAGAARILLLGFDLRPGHWHAEHPIELGRTDRSMYEVWRVRLERLAARLGEQGIEVVNCTPGSAMDMPYESPVQTYARLRETAR